MIRSHLMRVRLVIAAACCLIGMAACSASRQAKPDLPSPEYEPARAMPAASSAASAAHAPSDDAAEGEGQGSGGRNERLGGGESANKDADGILSESRPKGDTAGGISPAKPPTKDKTAERKRGDRPEPAASPESPPSPTMIPAPPAQVPAR